MHVLLYDDSSTFGGHERLCVTLARHLAVYSRDRVTFLLSRRAERLRVELLAACGHSKHLELLDLDIESRSFQGLRTIVSRGTVRRLAEVMVALNPDVAVIIQGTIEISSLGLEAARIAGLRTVSYVPWGHSMTRTGAALAGVRDRVNFRYYRSPDAFVTISQVAAADLRAWGVERECIHVVANSISMTDELPGDRDEHRRAHGLAPDDFVIGCIGRIDFRQKAQDVLVRFLASSGLPGVPWKLAVVGDGPDLAALTKLAAALGVASRVVHIPWTADVGNIYAMLDVLAIPSHYEGVPLVMLEALYRGLPVVAAARDGMAEMLPPQFLYPADCPEMLPLIIDRIYRTDTKAEMETLSAYVRENHTETGFGAGFRAAIAEVAERATSEPLGAAS